MLASKAVEFLVGSDAGLLRNDGTIDRCDLSDNGDSGDDGVTASCAFEKDVDFT